MRASWRVLAALIALMALLGRAGAQTPASEPAQATLNLSYTIVTAAQPGHVVQLSAAAGQYA